MNCRLVTYLVVVGVFLVSCLVAVLGLVGAFKIDASLLKWLAGVLLADSAACLYALFRQFDFRGDDNPKQAVAIEDLRAQHEQAMSQLAVEKQKIVEELTQTNHRLAEWNAKKDREIAALRDEVARIQAIFLAEPAKPKPAIECPRIDPFAN